MDENPNFELFERGKNEYKQTYIPVKKHPNICSSSRKFGRSALSKIKKKKNKKESKNVNRTFFTRGIWRNFRSSFQFVSKTDKNVIWS